MCDARYMVLSISFICLAFSLVSFSARADYQAGTFRCSKVAPNDEIGSVWRISVPKDDMGVPLVELNVPTILDVRPFTIRGYGTVTELHDNTTVVTVSAATQGARYFNLIFSKTGIRMGDTPCYKVQ